MRRPHKWSAFRGAFELEQERAHNQSTHRDAPLRAARLESSTPHRSERGRQSGAAEKADVSSGSSISSPNGEIMGAMFHVKRQILVSVPRVRARRRTCRGTSVHPVPGRDAPSRNPVLGRDVNPQRRAGSRRPCDLGRQSAGSTAAALDVRRAADGNRRALHLGSRCGRPVGPTFAGGSFSLDSLRPRSNCCDEGRAVGRSIPFTTMTSGPNSLPGSLPRVPSSAGVSRETSPQGTFPCRRLG